MSTDVEELLREGMERFTSDLRAPAGIVALAARRRSRRLALRSGGGVTAALAAGAVAVLAVGGPGAHHDGAHSPDITTDSVVAHVDHALLSVAGDVAQLSVSVSGATIGGKAAALTAAEWFYNRRWRVMIKTASGRTVSDESVVSTSSGTDLTVVSYATRTWGSADPLRLPYRITQPPRPGNCTGSTANPFADVTPGDLALVDSLAGFTSETMAQDLRTAISCANLTVAGSQRIDGVEAIKLTSTPKSPVSETIWINPVSYLPVRLVINGTADPAARTAAGKWRGLLTASFSWLRPTLRSQAELTAPVPAGYRRVPISAAMQAVTNQLLRAAAPA